MTTPLVVNGATYNFPTDGDALWGDTVTAWAIAVTNGLIPTTGGTFALSGQLDFGTAYGLRVYDITQASGSAVATSGFLKLTNSAHLTWRNAANTGDLALGFNSANQLTVNGTVVGGAAGSVPGASQQLLASDGSGGFYNVPYGTPGYILSSTGAGTVWIPVGSVISGNGIQVGATLPGSGTVGQYYYNSTDGLLYHWDGAGWTAAVPTAVLSGQITNGQIVDSAISSVKIADSAVTAAKTNLAAISPLSGLLNANTVNTAQLVNSAITSLKLADAAVTANKTALAAISNLTGGLNPAVVDAAQLVAGAVNDVALATGAVTASKTALAAIDPSSGTLAINAVAANNIIAGAIVAGKLATNSVVSANITAGAIVTSKLAAGAVTANEIQANAVTSAKIAAGAIIAGKIGAGVITATEIQSGTITSAQIAANTIVAGNILSGTITSTQIAANTIVASNIQAGTISATELAAGAVTASKLNVLVGGGNLAGNASFEALASGNRPNGWAAYTDGSVSYTYLRPTGRAAGTFAFGLQANATYSGPFGAYTDNTLEPPYGGIQNNYLYNTTYVVSFYARKVNGAGWTNMACWWPTMPTAVSSVNPTLTTSFQRYVFTVTFNSVVPLTASLNITVNGTTANGDQLVIDDVQVEQGDVVTSWAPRTNEILPGTIIGSYIYGGTITGDLIAANTITGGNIVANSITGGQIAAGTVTATNIDSRNLTIKDGSGTVIFSAGVPLGTAYASSGLINSNITITSGAITGIGSGSGTIVANSAIAIAAGALTGIGTGSGTIVDNAAITISGGAISGIGTGSGTQVANNTITLTINSDGTLSASGGPSASGGVTAVGLGAVKTDLSNAPSSIINGNISIVGGVISGIGTGAGTAVANGVIGLTMNSNGTISVTGGPSSSGAVTAPGINAVATDLSNAPSGILNSSIAISGGNLTGIGSGSGTAVANTLVGLSNSGGTISLINAGSGSFVALTTANPVQATNIASFFTTGAVTGTYIADATISTAKIATAAITTALIADAAISTAKIGDASITNAKIADASITTAKISSLDASVITAGSITTNKLQVGSVTTSSVTGVNSATLWPNGTAQYYVYGTLTGPTITTTGRDLFAGISGQHVLFLNSASLFSYESDVVLQLKRVSDGVIVSEVGAYQVRDWLYSGKTTVSSDVGMSVCFHGVAADTYTLQAFYSDYSFDPTTGSTSANIKRLDGYAQFFIFELKV